MAKIHSGTQSFHHRNNHTQKTILKRKICIYEILMLLIKWFCYDLGNAMAISTHQWACVEYRYMMYWPHTFQTECSCLNCVVSVYASLIIHCVDYPLRWLSIALIFHCVDYPLRWLSIALIIDCVDYPLRWLSIALIIHCVVYPLRWLSIALIVYPIGLDLVWGAEFAPLHLLPIWPEF
jgi:hypothetical protein